MSDEISRDMEIHPDFYKRMKEALNPDDIECSVFEAAVIILALIFLALLLCATLLMFSKIT